MLPNTLGILGREKSFFGRNLNWGSLRPHLLAWGPKMQMGFPCHKSACPQSRVSWGANVLACLWHFPSEFIWVWKMQNLWSKLHIRTEPSVTCSSQHHFGLLCVQGYFHTHCQLRGLSFIGTLSDLPKNCEVYIHSICCCQTKLFFQSCETSLTQQWPTA